MCGIAGIWGGAEEDVVHAMMERMVHRGPDAGGTFVGKSSRGVLGHRRLSIIDPTGGKQPILADSGNSALVANGEIYNYRSLNQELSGAHIFRTKSDSETILRLFHEFQESSAERLDGMFAFVIADDEHVFAARDPIGIKPLYIGRRNGQWCFASEQKALAGFAENVSEFPPGTYFHSVSGYRRFYHLPEIDTQGTLVSKEEAARKIREALETAVVKRLMSDVPLGAFLSGGLDSSIICAVARRHMDRLHTFSVGFEGSRDLAAARQVARHLDTTHHEYILKEKEVVELLPKIIYHLESYDQDLVRSAIPTYFTARLAREHVKVILTGEGADELFAGYRYHREIDGEDLQRELRRSIGALHNINLQRVDRLTMAHSIEARVPFLDVAMIALAQQIPACWKLRRTREGRLVEKWVLRKAFEDLLPKEIVWRDKEQFDEGSGTADLIGRLGLEHWLPARDVNRYTEQHTEAVLRSHEECAYHKVLRDEFPEADFILQNVARWSSGRLGGSNVTPSDHASPEDIDEV
jgi:asparagine synthase (glutamine-hydrolysing)